MVDAVREVDGLAVETSISRFQLVVGGVDGVEVSGEIECPLLSVLSYESVGLTAPAAKGNTDQE
jgi:hypothetical protein